MDDRQYQNRCHINLQDMTLDELAHIVSCDDCTKAFADYVETHSMLNAPVPMKESILVRSRQMDIQMIAKTNDASKQLQLFYYSLKVSFAAAFALGLLLWSPSILQGPPVISESFERAERPLYESAQQLTDRISDLSQQLFQMEVSFYDEQKK